MRARTTAARRARSLPASGLWLSVRSARRLLRTLAKGINWFWRHVSGPIIGPTSRVRSNTTTPLLLMAFDLVLLAKPNAKSWRLDVKKVRRAMQLQTWAEPLVGFPAVTMTARQLPTFCNRSFYQ